jgi:hypothetical protein
MRASGLHALDLAQAKACGYVVMSIVIPRPFRNQAYMSMAIML